MKNTVDVFIGLGSNMGDKDKNLATALQAVASLPQVKDIVASSVYTTQPQGYADQDWFANQVAQLVCDRFWSPQKLLIELLRIEEQMGRVSGPKWGPRIIDLDILSYGQHKINMETLCIPHPRMHERAFVLIPLLEIKPTYTFPNGVSAKEMLSLIKYEQTALEIKQ